jgi:hypothetical protein
LISATQANPIFKAINYFIPGAVSATSNHDLSMRPVNGVKKSKKEKARTIIPHFIRHYYAAAGTLFDMRNWQWSNNRVLQQGIHTTTGHQLRSNYAKDFARAY